MVHSYWGVLEYASMRYYSIVMLVASSVGGYLLDTNWETLWMTLLSITWSVATLLTYNTWITKLSLVTITWLYNTQCCYCIAYVHFLFEDRSIIVLLSPMIRNKLNYLYLYYFLLPTFTTNTIIYPYTFCVCISHSLCNKKPSFVSCSLVVSGYLTYLVIINCVMIAWSLVAIVIPSAHLMMR